MLKFLVYSWANKKTFSGILFQFSNLFKSAYPWNMNNEASLKGGEKSLQIKLNGTRCI